MYRVRIKKLPGKRMGGPKTGQQTSTGALSIQPTALGGSDIDQYIGEKELIPTKTMQPVPRDKANVEVEKGEVIAGDLAKDGMLQTAIAGGKRHFEGGTPLNLPDDTFIFSDTKAMKIKDPDFLAKFGKTSGSYTPAELAKQYDVSKYRKILQDPNSDSVDKKTAELMIRNYTMKLGGLALAQESKKGFPQGVPLLSKPYLQANGVSEEQIMPKYQPKFSEQGEEMESEEEDMGEPQEEVTYDESMPTQMPDGQDIAMSDEMQGQPMAAYGMSMGGYPMPYAQGGLETFNPYNRSQQAIDADNQAYMERTRNMVYPAGFNNNTNIPNESYDDQLWYTMGMSDQGLQNYTNSFSNDGQWKAPLPKEQWSPKRAEGGLVKAQDGAETKKLPPYTEAEGYSAKGVVELNKYRKMYGLPQLKGSVTKADIKKAAGELQSKIIENNPELVSDYMTNRSHKPNNKLAAILKQKGYASTNEGVKKALADNKITKDDIKTAYKDDLWWYRALETNTKELSKDEYEKKMKDPNAIKQGDILYFNEDPNNPQAYTQYVMKDAAKDNKAVTVPETEEETERPDLVDVDEAGAQDSTAYGWTMPDTLNMFGALKDKAGIKKYMPWAAPVDSEEARGRYLDVTRPAAAIAEQANIAQQNLAQFTGSPQEASARAMGIQGQAAGQVADLMANYNNQNVNIGNQLEQGNVGIRNQERQLNQGISKQLYDQTTVANQAYDNAKNQADQQIRLAMQQGWKNASDIANVSATSDQYDIDPWTGRPIFTGGKDAVPETSATFNALLNDYIAQGFEPKDAIAAAKIAMGEGSSGIDVDAIMQNAKDGGMYVMGSNVFPFMFY